jgi:thioredoxin reductase (NADPH)
MKDNTQPSRFDCLVVGGGPAGLLAAVYLGRFRRRVLVAVTGESRANNIPCTLNLPGFPFGINGKEMLARLREQAMRYGTEFIERRVTNVEHCGSYFNATCGTLKVRVPLLLLATGARDRMADLPQVDSNLARGTLRLCPVCDGYEVIDRKIGVLGGTRHALREALFLKTFSSRVTLLLRSREEPDDDVRRLAQKAGIEVREQVAHLVSGTGGYEAVLSSGSIEAFEVIYPALGCDVRSELARDLGVACDAVGHIFTGAHQETNVPGVFAAGDVVQSLNQMAVAFGQAATAATAIHNALKEQEPPQERSQEYEGGKGEAQ